jgi:hypothetical protein
MEMFHRTKNRLSTAPAGVPMQLNNLPRYARVAPSIREIRNQNQSKDWIGVGDGLPSADWIGMGGGPHQD